MPRCTTLAYMFAMRTSEQSPYGVNGFSTLFVAIEQFAPCAISALASATPRMTLCSW